jgi:hypothetical protein
MPGIPFATPVTLDELWKNVLYDFGVPATTSSDQTSMESILLALDAAVTSTAGGVYGNASDGVCTFIATGSTTVAGATLSGGVYTMTRDIYLATGSVVSVGATIKTSGFRIFCQGNLTINGVIDSSGSAAAANVAGAALSYSGTISNTTVGTAGAAGGTGTSTAGTNGAANGLGGAGGVGGTSGSNTGAAGGTVTAPVATVQGPYTAPNAIAVRVVGTTALALCCGGSGGSSGGGDGTNNSGGGGGGGGIVMISANTINGTGTISANGGVGGAANATGNSAGGGGGGGGAIILVSSSVGYVQPTVTGGVATVNGVTLTVAGGAGGAKTGTGTVGGAGVAGSLILITN